MTNYSFFTFFLVLIFFYLLIVGVNGIVTNTYKRARARTRTHTHTHTHARADPVRSEKSPRGIWDQHSGTEADFRLLHVNIHANNVPYSLIHHQWAKSGPINP